MRHHGFTYEIILILLIIGLIAANLLIGSVHIPAGAVWDILCGNEVEKAGWTFIVRESRFPQTLTALLCGAALSASGLMLQTVFNNPLADSSILGISSGSSVGVALVMLAGGGSIAAGTFTLSGFVTVMLGAFAGAIAVMGLILFLSTLIRNSIMLLIAGIMILLPADPDGTGDVRIAHQTPERPAAGSTLCREPGHQHPPHPEPAPAGNRPPDSRDHRLLRSRIIHRPGCAPPGPPAAGHLQPQPPDAGYPADRRRTGPAVQPAVHPARKLGSHPAECRHPDTGRAGHHLCHHQPT